MVYVGSKNRLAKYLVPIISSYIDDNTSAYIEPFVGGNVIDKIQFDNRIGYDCHRQLIALLKHLQETKGEDLPEWISEEEYQQVRQNREDYEDWYVGLVGFCSTFGAKYFGGYGRDKGGKRSISNERIRNLKRQAPNLAGIKFECADFRTITIPENSVVYCDPPYRNTIKYKGTGNFPYEEFYNWCRENSEHSRILISEYNMPDDFKLIWEKESILTFDSNREKGSSRTERLFTL